MSKIKLMNESLANKIAAGEVIERIANVVKELVENSIDAGSTNITVNLLDSGKTKIEVIDNGSGMDRSDAKLCFLRHATSKVYNDDDLFFINTLGFRGEALASIASVSEVILNTYDGKESTSITIKGSKIISTTDGQKRKGTHIKVNKLFYNTPARLKYLKSDRSELNLVVSYIEKLSLANPKISFTLTNNNQTLIKTSGKNLLKAINEIYGLEISKNTIPIHLSSDDYDIDGFICKPEILKKNKNHMHVFINGRVIKNFELLKTIDEAYHTYKPDGFYPVVFINIFTDPSLTDVNIHPTKQDIKISKMAILKTEIRDSIKNALYSDNLVSSPLKFEETLESKLPINLFEEPFEETKEVELVKREYTAFSDSTFKVEEQSEFDFKSINEQIRKIELYPVGIAFGTYIIAENKEGIYLIDQHAAQERINYEKILRSFLKNEQIDMLVPITMELSTSEYDIVMKMKDKLIEMGFNIEPFGPNTIKIDSHPTWVKESKEKDTIKEVINVLTEEEKNFDALKFNDKVAATVACKASIKGNSRITLDAANFILEQLVLCDNPYNCPHGRPTIIKFTIYELEKMFKRSM